MFPLKKKKSMNLAESAKYSARHEVEADTGFKLLIIYLKGSFFLGGIIVQPSKFH